MSSTVYQGDCVKVMRQRIADERVDLVITSPPYDGLRTYNGYSFDFEAVANELWRVVKSGGVCVWVVGDQTKNGSESGTSFRQALYFKEVGFKLHDTMIWTKAGGGAVGSQLCYTQNWEFMFVLSKGRPSVVNLIRDLPNQSAGKDKSGVGRRNAAGTHKIETRKPCAEVSRRNNYWYIPPERGEHPAVFPLKLAQDHVLSWSNEGATVLDPFAGSGTTGVACKLLKRNFIGIDCSADYVALAKRRIAGVK